MNYYLELFFTGAGDLSSMYFQLHLHSVCINPFVLSPILKICLGESINGSIGNQRGKQINRCLPELKEFVFHLCILSSLYLFADNNGDDE